jgi:hypothetical protein
MFADKDDWKCPRIDEDQLEQYLKEKEMLEQKETIGGIENSQKLLLWGLILIMDITRNTLNVPKCICSTAQARTYRIEYLYVPIVSER